MKYNWDLNSLYLKKEDFYYDMTLVRDKLKKVSEYREIKVDGCSLYDLMSKCFEIREISSKTLLYASLNYYSNINDDSFIKMKEQAEELDNYVREETNFIDELITIISEDKLNSFCRECPDLKKYSFYISNIKRMSKHIVNNKFDVIEKSSKNINDNIIKYNNIFKTMTFGKINDVTLNNSNIGKYLIDSDCSIRKEVFNNLNNSYKDKSSDFFSIINSIVQARKKITKAKQYSSVLESELDGDNIKDLLIDNLIKSVNNNINLMNKYLKLKCDYLKIDNPSLYDINVPIIDNKDKYDLDSAIDILSNVFDVFGKEYVSSMKYLLDNHHLSLECDENKHPSIVFSWNTYSFMNYKERYIDIKNLAHEFGHIINCYFSLKKQPYIYSDSTVFTGEVASLVNEILLNDYLYNNSDSKEQKIFYLTKIIENFISQVYRQTMYTEFENLLYNSSQLDLNCLNDEYLNLIKKYYGDVINIDRNISYEWMRVGHLFRWSYYVYKYAIGYILAFNVVKKLKESDFVANYIDFLSSGSCCSNEDLLKKLNIDLYAEDLISNSFILLDNYIFKLEEMLCEEKKDEFCS